MLERDLETGELYEVQGATWQDWLAGGLWTIVGLGGLVRAHIAGQLRSLRGW